MDNDDDLFDISKRKVEHRMGGSGCIVSHLCRDENCHHRPVRVTDQSLFTKSPQNNNPNI